MDGYIYVIQQKNTNFYKIGYTSHSNPRSRLTNLQVGNPNTLIFVSYFIPLILK